MITKAEFINLSKSKSAPDGLWLDRYFITRMSPTVAYWLARANVSANAATLSFFALALLADFLLIIPIWWTPLATLALYIVVRILDEADGRLARYFKTQSKFGEILDMFSELPAHSMFFVALGLRLYLETGLVWTLIFGCISVLPYLYEGLWVKLSDELIGPFEPLHPTTLWSRFRTIYVNYDYILSTAIIVSLLYALQTFLYIPYLVLIFFAAHIIVSFLVKIVLRFTFVLRRSGKGEGMKTSSLSKGKIHPLHELAEILKTARKGKRVVYQSGVFDLFHFGHFNALKKASELGDILVVQIDGDIMTKRRKGKDRPYLGEAFRAEMIAAFGFVDYVFVANTPNEDPHTLKSLRPNVMLRAKRAVESDDLRQGQMTQLASIIPDMEVVWLEETPEISTSMLIPIVGKNGTKYDSVRVPAVSVGICAYNEEQNISDLLDSILRQKQKGFDLEEIIVVSDGSTDKTVEKVAALNSPLIKLIDHLDRVGVALRQNEILRSFSGDVLVLLNADIVLTDDELVSKLTQSFSDPRVGLVGGKVTPLPAKNFFERVINFSVFVKQNVYESINSGNNVFLCHGRVRAFAKDFARTLRFPPVAGEDAYSYLECKRMGYKFFYEKKAQIFYRSPQNFRDHLRQSKRFLKGHSMIIKHYNDILNLKIPRTKVIKAGIKSILSHPVLTLSYVSILLACYANSLFYTPNVLWEITSSSKILR